MKVIEFDTKRGLYVFQIKSLKTELHSHPAVEILFAENGHFDLITEKETYKNLVFAAIGSNIKHKILTSEHSIKTVMIEHHDEKVKEILSQFGLGLKDGISFQTDHATNKPAFNPLYNALLNIRYEPNYDPRVLKVIQYLNDNDLSFNEMTGVLTSITHLSWSRLSHLFKDKVGVSIKKYLLWCKLKSTINLHLQSDEDLFSSLIRSGFYDHPHFSKAFKTMLGVKPSEAYNSRTVQG